MPQAGDTIESPITGGQLRLGYTHDQCSLTRQQTMNTPVYDALVPMLPVSDVKRAMAFYQQLGFSVGNTHAPDDASDPVWAWLYCGGAHVMINLAERAIDVTHGSAAVWLYCADVNAMHALLKARGLDVGEVSYPFYNPRGEFHVHDPDGYAIFIAHGE